MNLEDLQRTMAAAVMQPLTSDEAMQPRDTTGRWQGRAMDEVVGQFIAPNSRLTAFERLEIYNRQYWFRLQTAFSEDFPALRAVVGTEGFQSLMNAYLGAQPSRSFTLRNLGAHLCLWLRENPQFAGRKIALALDVARVEWACVEAFDGAEFPPLRVEEIAALGPNPQLALQPHVQLLALDYPADDLVLDLHQRQKRESSEAGTRPESGEDESAPPLRLRKRPAWLAIHRVDHSIYYKRLSPPEYRTLTALQAGHTLAEALDAAFSNSQRTVASQIRQVQQWFATWAQLGWLVSPQT